MKARSLSALLLPMCLLSSSAVAQAGPSSMELIRGDMHRRYGADIKVPLLETDPLHDEQNSAFWEEVGKEALSAQEKHEEKNKRVFQKHKGPYRLHSEQDAVHVGPEGVVCVLASGPGNAQVTGLQKVSLHLCGDPGMRQAGQANRDAGALKNLFGQFCACVDASAQKHMSQYAPLGPEELEAYTIPLKEVAIASRGLDNFRKAIDVAARNSYITMFAPEIHQVSQQDKDLRRKFRNCNREKMGGVVDSIIKDQDKNRSCKESSMQEMNGLIHRFISKDGLAGEQGQVPVGERFRDILNKRVNRRLWGSKLSKDKMPGDFKEVEGLVGMPERRQVLDRVYPLLRQELQLLKHNTKSPQQESQQGPVKHRMHVLGLTMADKTALCEYLAKTPFVNDKVFSAFSAREVKDLPTCASSKGQNYILEHGSTFLVRSLAASAGDVFDYDVVGSQGERRKKNQRKVDFNDQEFERVMERFYKTSIIDDAKICHGIKRDVRRQCQLIELQGNVRPFEELGDIGPSDVPGLAQDMRKMIGPSAPDEATMQRHLDQMLCYVHGRGASLLAPQAQELADANPMFAARIYTPQGQVARISASSFEEEQKAQDNSSIAQGMSGDMNRYYDRLAADAPASRSRQGGGSLPAPVASAHDEVPVSANESRTPEKRAQSQAQDASYEPVAQSFAAPQTGPSQKAAAASATTDKAAIPRAPSAFPTQDGLQAELQRKEQERRALAASAMASAESDKRIKALEDQIRELKAQLERQRDQEDQKQASASTTEIEAGASVSGVQVPSSKDVSESEFSPDASARQTRQASSGTYSQERKFQSAPTQGTGAANANKAAVRRYVTFKGEQGEDIIVDIASPDVLTLTSGEYERATQDDFLKWFKDADQEPLFVLDNRTMEVKRFLPIKHPTTGALLRYECLDDCQLGGEKKLAETAAPKRAPASEGKRRSAKQRKKHEELVKKMHEALEMREHGQD